MEAEPEPEPEPEVPGLLRSTAGLKELGVWNERHSLWTRGLRLRDGRVVLIAEDYATADETADGVWTLFPASVVLSRFVEASLPAHAASEDGSRCGSVTTVELGAGSGVVSMVAAAAVGARAFATDQASELAYVKRNFAINAGLLGSQAAVRALGWGVEEHVESAAKILRQSAPDGLTVLLGADITYRPAAFGILCETLRRLADAAPGRVRAWLTHDVASEHASGMRGRERFFGTPVSCAEPDGDGADDGLCTGGLVHEHGFTCRQVSLEKVLQPEWLLPTVSLFELT